MARIFYHVTRKDRLRRIMKEGLKPASETCIQNTFYGGVTGDPDYVYLFSSSVIGNRVKYSMEICLDKKGWSVLQVSLPENHPVERDYDQVLQSWDDIWDSSKKRFYEEYFGSFGVDFTGKATKKNLFKTADSISRLKWEKNVGSYRTPKTIHPEYLKPVSMDDIL